MKMLKQRSQPWIVALSVLTMLAVSAATAYAQEPGEFTTIDYPDAIATYAQGINPGGDIVGSYFDANSDLHGFLLRNGTLTSFDYPGLVWDPETGNGGWTDAFGISPQGDIVGQIYTVEDWSIVEYHGYLLRNGTFIPIDIPLHANTMPTKISPKGTIVGCTHGDDGMWGFERTDKGVVTLQPIDGTMNNGINPRGDIVGTLWPDSYLIHDGGMTIFNFEGATDTEAQDISPTGTVVGWYFKPAASPPRYHGFIMENGEMTSFDVPGKLRTFPYGISATGDVVGYFMDWDHTEHGFLLKRH